MSYEDRSALLPSAPRARKSQRVTLAYNRVIVVDGQIVGSWRRRTAGSSSVFDTDFLLPLNRAQRQAVDRAARRFTEFAG
jgi:hypothetical protein